MSNPLSKLLGSLAIAAFVAGLTGCAATSAPDYSPARLAKASCMRSGGSHLAAPNSDCQNVPGRSFSSHEIERTGVIDPAEALRMLDPAVTGGP